MNITIEEIDAVRLGGYRPQVVGCFLNDKKILLFIRKNMTYGNCLKAGLKMGKTLAWHLKEKPKKNWGMDFGAIA